MRFLLLIAILCIAGCGSSKLDNAVAFCEEREGLEKYVDYHLFNDVVECRDGTWTSF